MTFRSVLLGLAWGVAICSLTYLNNNILQMTFLTGHHLPFSIFGALAIFLLVANPLLHKLRKGWAFSAREVAVAAAIALCSCAIPGSGLMRSFTNCLVMPIHFNNDYPEWRSNKVLSLVPENLLVDTEGEEGEEVVEGFVWGLGKRDRHISLSEVPFSGWWEPLRFWVPFVLTIFVGVIGLTFVVHRQWSDREHLAFPVAEFASMLIRGDPDRAYNPIFHNRVFWIGYGGITFVHIINTTHLWFNQFPVINTYMNLWALKPHMGSVGEGFGWVQFFLGMIHPTVIAFAYFVPSDVSFTLGIGAITTMIISAMMTAFGMGFPPTATGSGTVACWQFGGYFAFFVMILYIGRSHYWATVKGAFLPVRGESSGGNGDTGPRRAEPEAVWGARIAILSGVLLVIMISGLGVSWPIAVAAVVLAAIAYTVLARIIAETGLFFLQSMWHPVLMVESLAGLIVLGPKMVAILMLLSAPILIDFREAIMPHVVNALQIGHRQGQPMGRVGLVLPWTLAACLGVAIVVTLYIQYDRGTNRGDAYGTETVPKLPFDAAVKAVNQLQSDPERPNALERSEEMSTMERLASLDPVPGAIPTIAVGFVIVIFLSLMRLRFTWWPIHPVLILVIFTYPILCFWAGFTFGWIIKISVLKFGGGRVYNRIKPMMAGIIAGELAWVFLYFLFGLGYWLVTGTQPKAYWIFPG
jgi:hypothetical protein